ncbi:MAG TPA: hypothetical protein VFJ77_07850 [Gaiellaceae bacterium]|nr:hypothetical protein [Gaiellaceae bacterium]
MSVTPDGAMNSKRLRRLVRLGAGRRTALGTLLGTVVAATLVSLFVVAPAFAGNACSSQATGNWSSAATWTSCGGTAPQSGDTVTINAGHTVTVDTNATIAGVTISGGTLALGGGSLTDTGSFTLSSGTFDNGTAKTLELDGNITIASGVTWTTGTGFVKLAGSGNSTYNVQTAIQPYIVIVAIPSGTTKTFDNSASGANGNQTTIAVQKELRLGVGSDTSITSCQAGTYTATGVLAQTGATPTNGAFSFAATAGSGACVNASGGGVGDGSTATVKMTTQGSGTLVRLYQTGSLTQGSLPAMILSLAGAGNIDFAAFAGAASQRWTQNITVTGSTGGFQLNSSRFVWAPPTGSTMTVTTPSSMSAWNAIEIGDESGSGNAGRVSIANGSTLNMSGHLVLNDGYLDAAGTGAVTLAGTNKALVLGSAFDGGTAPITISGSTTQISGCDGANNSFTGLAAGNKCIGDVAATGATLPSSITITGTSKLQGNVRLSSGTWNMNGTLQLGTGANGSGSDAPTFYSRGSTINGTQTLNNLVEDGTGTTSTIGNTVSLNGNLTLGSSATTQFTGGTIAMTPATGTTTSISSASAGKTIASNLTINGADSTSNVSVTGTAAEATVSGTLTLTQGKLSAGTLDVQGNASAASTFGGGAGTLTFNNTSAGRTFTGTQTSAAGDLPNVTIANTGQTLTLSGSLRASRNWTLSSGTLDASTNSTTFYANGTTFSGSQALYNLTALANTTISSGTLSVANTLTFNGGKIATGANVLAVTNTATGAVTGASQANGWVNGNLRRSLPGSGSSQAYTWDVGGSSNWSPATLTPATLTGSGTITMSATSSDATHKSTWQLSSTKYAKRYWTTANSGVTWSGGASLKLQYVTGDLQGTPDETAFVVGRDTDVSGSGSWSNLTSSADAVTHATTASGITSIQSASTQFAVGEVGFGPLDHFKVEASTGGNIGDQTAGTGFDIKITAQDASNLTVSSFTGTVTLSSVGSTCTAQCGVTASFVNGVLTVTGVTLTTKATGVTLHVTDGTHTGDSNAFNVNAAAPSTYAISGATSSTAGQNSANVTITLKDAFGNTATATADTTITPVSSSSGANKHFRDTSNANETTVTITSGSSTADFRYYDEKAGSWNFTFTNDKSLTNPSAYSFTVNAAAPATYAISGATSSTAGQNSNDLTITLKDSFGNTATATADTTITPTSSSSGGAKAFKPSSATAGGSDGSGQASFVIANGSSSVGFKYYDEKAGSWNFTFANDKSLTDPIAYGFTVNAGTASTYAISGATSSTAGQNSTNLTITLQDSFGNTATAAADTTITPVSSSDGANKHFRDTSNANETTVTITSGSSTHDFRYYDEKAGSWSFTFTNDKSLTNPSAYSFTVDAAAPSTYAISGANSSTAGQNSANVTITLKDAFGNTASATADTTITPVSSSSGANKHFRDTSNANETTVTITSGSSTADFRYYDEKAGSWSFTFTNDKSLTNPSAYSFTVNAGTPSTYAVTGATSTTAGQNSADVTLTLQDAFGNTATATADTTITPASSSGGANKAFKPSSATAGDSDGTGQASFVIANGSSSVSFKYYDEKAGSWNFTFTNDKSLTNPSAYSFTVDAGTATQLQVRTSVGAATVNPLTAGADQTIKVVAVDGFDNTDTSFSCTACSVTFSGAAIAPDGTTHPTVNGTNFGSGTSVDFSAGVSTTVLTMHLFNADETQPVNVGASIGAPQNLSTLDTAHKLAATVVASTLDHFTFDLTSPQRNRIAFTGTNTLTANDAYDNTVTTFDSSTDNVVITSDSGTVVNDTISTGAGAFSNGVSDLTAQGIQLNNPTLGSRTLTATSQVTNKTGQGTVTLQAGHASTLATGSTATRSKATVQIGGTDTATISLQLKDQDGNALTTNDGLNDSGDVTASATDGTLGGSSCTSDCALSYSGSNGIFTTTIQKDSGSPATATITVEISGTEVNSYSPSPLTVSFTNDTNAPDLQLSLSSSSNAAIAEDTAAYAGSAGDPRSYWVYLGQAGSFTLHGDASDATGVADIAFPDITGSGWTNGGAVDRTTGAGGTSYAADSNSYAFTGSATTSPTLANPVGVSATDTVDAGAGGPYTVTDTLTFVTDQTGPGGGGLGPTTGTTGGDGGDGSVSAGGSGFGGYDTDGTYSFTVTPYSEAGPDATHSGLASDKLYVQSAPLSADSCGSYSPADPGTDITASISGGVLSETGKSDATCYRYTHVGVDNVGNTVTTVLVIKVDKTAPSGTLALDKGSNTDAYVNGSTIFLRPSTTSPGAGIDTADGGTFTATITASDAATGTTKVDFPDVTARAHASGSTGGTVSGSSPYQESYVWDTSAAGSSAFDAVLHDKAGNTTNVPFTVAIDTTAPTGGDLAPNSGLAGGGSATPGDADVFGGYSNIAGGGSYSIAVTPYAETGDTTTNSGLLSDKLYELQGSLTGDVCSFGVGLGTDITASIDGSNHVSATHNSGDHCYRYTHVGIDNVGNQMTTSLVVKVDLTAPSSPTLGVTETDGAGSASANPYSFYDNAGTLYFNGATSPAHSGHFELTVSSTDTGSGIAAASGVSFPDLSAAGVTSGAAYGSGTSPYASTEYAWDTASAVPTAGATGTITVTDRAGNSNTVDVTLDVDTTAPAPNPGPDTSTLGSSGDLIVNGARADTYSTTGTYDASWAPFTETEASGAAGLLSSATTREVSTLTNNTCPSYGSASDISGTNPTHESSLATDCYRYTLTGTDNVGNATTIQYVVKVDRTGPSGGSISYFDGPTTASSVPVNFDRGSTPPSGFAHWKVQKATGGLSGSTCSGYGSFVDIASDPGGTSVTASGLSAGNCYEFQLVVTDNAGNSKTFTSSSQVKVQGTNPIEVFNGTPGETYQSGNTLYVANTSDTFKTRVASGFTSGVQCTAWTGSADSAGDVSPDTDSGNRFPSGTYTATSDGATITLDRYNDSTCSGAPTTDALTITVDASAPSGTISYAEQEESEDAVAITVNGATDSGSGVATDAIYRWQGDYDGSGTAAGCSNWSGSPTTVTLSGGKDTTVTDNHCYIYQRHLVDHVGNTTDAKTAGGTGAAGHAGENVALVPDLTPPTYQGPGTLDGPGPVVLKLPMSEPVDCSATPTSVWTITYNGTPIPASDILSVTVSSNVITLTLADPGPDQGQTVKVEYTPPTPSSDGCKDPHGNPTPHFGPITIPNGIPVSTPTPTPTTTPGPGPHLVFVDPADGSTVDSTTQLTLTANTVVDWVDMTVTQPDGTVVNLDQRNGSTTIWDFKRNPPSQVGHYTIRGRITANGQSETILSHFTIWVPGAPPESGSKATVPVVQKNAYPDQSGTLESSDKSWIVNWPSGMFGDRAVVNVQPLPADTVKALPPNSILVEAYAFWVASGDSIHSLPKVLELQFTNAAPGVEPLTSEDGENWTVIPQLSGTTLPDGQEHGYYRDGANTIHVLTRHLTYFALPRAATAGLTLRIMNPRRIWLANRSWVGIRLELSRPAKVTTYYIRNGHKLPNTTQRTHTLRAGVTIHRVYYPKSLRPGRYQIQVVARGVNGERAARTARLRIYANKPTSPLRRGMKPVGVVIVRGAEAALLGLLPRNLGHDFMVATTGKTANAIFHSTDARTNRKVGGVVVDLDRLPLTVVSGLHNVFPELQIVALTSHPSDAAGYRHAGAAVVVAKPATVREITQALQTLLPIHARREK